LINPEANVVCFENHMKNTDALCGQTAEIFNAEVDGTYSIHCASRVNGSFIDRRK
jgi:hypothetical protein